MPTRQQQAKVKTMNRAHKYASVLYDQLSAICADFVGDKIIKNDGGLMDEAG
jgi:hypothetical protein